MDKLLFLSGLVLIASATDVHSYSDSSQLY